MKQESGADTRLEVDRAAERGGERTGSWKEAERTEQGWKGNRQKLNPRQTKGGEMSGETDRLGDLSREGDNGNHNENVGDKQIDGGCGCGLKDEEELFVFQRSE